MNGTLKRGISKLTGFRQRDWDVHLQEAVNGILHAPNRSTHESPYFLSHGQDPRTRLDNSVKLRSVFVILIKLIKRTQVVAHTEAELEPKVVYSAC